ncbi:MYND-type domain-containing protein [Mycena kentingensis (nom. inval.)]|nr:MYND-type domain-containing protein [Mycena kentingensis (nom. inval.)]
MHPSLQLRLTDLRRLPASIRLLASNAVQLPWQTQNSKQSIVVILQKLQANELPRSCLPLLVPLFFSIIDESNISYLRNFAEHGVDAYNSCFVRSVNSISAMSSILKQHQPVLAAQTELWNRVWAWAQVLDELREQLPFDDFMMVNALSACYNVFKRIGEDHTPHKQDLLSTPGFYRVLGRSWEFFLACGADEEIAQMSVILYAVSERPHFFGDLTEGAGGVNGLASVLTRTLRRSIIHPDKPLPPRSIALLTCTVMCIGYTGIAGDYRNAACEHGLVTVLVHLCRSLCVSEFPLSETDVLDLMFKYLFALFHGVSAHDWICEALEAGLLKAILLCAANSRIPNKETKLRRFLVEAVPEGTVSYRCLSQLENSLEEVYDDDIDAPDSLAAGLRVRWDAMIELAHERFKLMDAYDTGELTERRACDNHECWAIRSKKGTEAMQTDYRYHHRERCSALAKIYQVDAENFSDVDRSFLRALITHSYTTHRASIASKLLPFLRGPQFAGVMPYVVFAYKRGRCTVTLRARNAQYYELTAEDPPGVFDGRVAYHVMELHHGGLKKPVVRAYRLRMSSDEFMKGILNLARDTVLTIPDFDFAQKELDRLLELDVDYVH